MPSTAGKLSLYFLLQLKIDEQHVASLRSEMYTVHCFAGLFGEDVRCLFVILLVFLHLNTVTPLSLSANESHSPLKGLCVYHDISSLVGTPCARHTI